MAGNLTAQVRGIAKVVTAVANGDLKRKLTVEAKGEIAELADTINGMIDTLATFADQVTTVAREVGVEGQLGGQAKVPGAAGTWKDLTENVNQLAANLTTQVRAIAEVATAVTKGDLTRSITVEAQGEVAALKDNINEMIRNLQDTTQKNTEQDWLKTNLAKFSRMLQGQRDLTTVGRMILSELCPGGRRPAGRVLHARQRRGGQAAAEPARQLRLRRREKRSASSSAWAKGWSASAPGKAEDPARRTCRPITSASRPAWASAAAQHHRAAGRVRRPGQGRARTGLVRAVQPDAPGVPRSVDRIDRHRAQHDRSQHADGDLLKQSQSLAQQLQTRQEELQQTNQELQEKARLLAHQNQEVGTQEPGSRTGPPGPGRKGQAARPHVQVQVRVPGQHVARAADAAQQPAHPLRPALPRTPKAT